MSSVFFYFKLEKCHVFLMIVVILCYLLKKYNKTYNYY